LSDDGHRHYQMRWLRVGVRAMYIAFGAIGVVIVLGNAYDARHCAACDHSFPVGTAVFVGLCVPALIAWVEAVAIKTGLEECDDGYIVRRNFGSSRLRLRDVARFAHTTGSIPIVYAVRRDGKRVAVPGLIEGRQTVWDGGRTGHIVDVLNERLERRLAQAGETA